MKIGIISMQRVTNYGSFLQAYGLKQIIERLGHKVVFIDYKSGKPAVPYSRKKAFLHRCRYFSLASKAYDLFQYYLLNKKTFRCEYNLFYLRKLGVSYRRNNQREKVDIAVIGSDEVFNCLQPGPQVGFTPMLFGQGINAKKVISYAASFGYTTMEGLRRYKLTDTLAKYMKTFSAISVRDENSRNIITRLTDRRPELNLDPALVNDYELPKKEIPYRNYVVLYTYKSRPYSESEIAEIKDFCKRNGKTLISLGDAKPWVENRVQADPFEMLCYIKKADFVVTDTFHGTVFAIKYNRNFVSMIREDNYQKLNDLLTRLRLESRKITGFSELQEMLENVPDFSETNRILELEKENTYEYLERNLRL